MALLAAVASPRSPRFPLLDAVRAIAALSVLVFHVGLWSGLAATGSAAAPFLARLDVGVTIFFLLSGFLLYRPFARARLLGAPPPGAVAYGWRRVLRIVPAYWVALTLVALWLRQGDVLELGGAVYYGFLQIYGDKVFGGLPIAWSLCIEVVFYAFLPLWAWCLRRVPGGVRAELGGLALLAVAAVAFKLVVMAGAEDPGRVNGESALLWMPAYLDHFAIGMALAVISAAAEQEGRWRAVADALGRRPAVAWALAAGAFALISVGVGMPREQALGAPLDVAHALARHGLYAVVALGVLLPAAFGPADRGRIRGLLALRPLLAVGVVSYGLFLWHLPFVQKAAEWTGPQAGTWSDFLVVLAIGLGGGLVAAAISWRLIERPFLRLKRLVPDRALPARDPETHAVATR